MRPYWLFCAGEDSGDVLGESLVQEILEKGFDALGAGGRRMEGAGLLPLVPFDDLPVNGFGDVLLHSHRLAKNFKILRRALQNENCHGLVAVDYPGFNLKLMQLALQMEKRVIYVEPPQIWAWKPKRVQAFLLQKPKGSWNCGRCTISKSKRTKSSACTFKKFRIRFCKKEILLQKKIFL